MSGPCTIKKNTATHIIEITVAFKIHTIMASDMAESLREKTEVQNWEIKLLHIILLQKVLQTN